MCDFWSFLASTGLALELASIAVTLFGSMAVPLFQSALTGYVESMVNFAACMLGMI